MNAPVTRRALLGATAAISAVALPVAALARPPHAATAGADAELRILVERHAKLAVAWDAACLDLDAARDRAEAAYPPRPATLTATALDFLHGLAPSGRSRHPDGRAWIFFNRDDLDRLRTAEPVMSHVLDDTGDALVAMPNPVGEARRREIVETYDHWLADRGAVDGCLGLTAAEAVEEPLCTAMQEAEAAVESYLPVTLAGICVKAAWVLARCNRADAALAFVRQLAGGAAPPIGNEEADATQVAA